MAAGKFAVGDMVRFIGTHTLLIVRQHRQGTDQYQIQQGEEAAMEWVLGIHLERVERIKIAQAP